MLSTYRERQGEEGFTLIELLVVIIIIGILAAIAIPTFLGQRERARRGAVQSDLRNLAINAETYFTDEQSYDDWTEGTEWDRYAPSSGVVLTGFYGAGGFCVFGEYLDAADVSLLPAADGTGWYYNSTASPQLQNQADGADCTDNQTTGTPAMTQGAGTGGQGPGDPGVIDGR